MLGEVVDISFNISRRNVILVDDKRKTLDHSLQNRRNVLPHKIHKLSLREAGRVERPQNLLLRLLILSLEVFGDLVKHLHGGSWICASHNRARINPIFLESDTP